MRHPLAGAGLAALCLALGGCVADTVYHATGVSTGQRDADAAACTAEARAAYPVRMVTRFRPPEYVPPREVCTAPDNCTIYPGYFRPAVPYTVDVNAAPRRTAFRGCMGGRGYDRIELPYCPEGTAVRRSTRMPPLASDTCLLRQRDAPPLIVNPA